MGSEDDSHVERESDKRIWQVKLAPAEKSGNWSNNIMFSQIT